MNQSQRFNSFHDLSFINYTDFHEDCCARMLGVGMPVSEVSCEVFGVLCQ